MAYTKTQWVNDSEPPVNAENLNKIETGIDEAHSLSSAETSRAKAEEEKIRASVNAESLRAQSEEAKAVKTVNGNMPDIDGNVSLTIPLLANNLTTETPGKALDARQGKVLNDMIGEIRIPISKTTLSKRSNTKGSINLGLSDTVYSYIAAKVISVDGDVPIYLIPFNANGVWYVRALNRETGADVVSTNITLTVFVIEAGSISDL